MTSAETSTSIARDRTVLLVGGGGREHALAAKLAESPRLAALHVAPGNPGIAQLPRTRLVPIAIDEVQGLVEYAVGRSIDLAVIGPELPLTLGLADELRRRGIATFGPGRGGAEIEGSKVFAKQFMTRHGIPTADYEIAQDETSARAAAARFGFPVVLKADGLAAGKGVLLPADAAELDAALRALFSDRRFGASGDRVVVERFEPGEEVSFMALCDGERALPLVTARDHKRLLDGDRGPNTGGMGAFSPSGLLSAQQAAEVLHGAILPALRGLARENRRFVGVLYAGLMVAPDGGFKVLEFNARFGDPEAQVILLRLEDDLVEVLGEAAAGRFERSRLAFRKEVAACVVLASRGYPEAPVKGEPISGLDAAARLPGVSLYHAGTARREADGAVLAAGGRVLGACAIGQTLDEALARAYAAADTVDWPSKILRRDIGRRVAGA